MNNKVHEGMLKTKNDMNPAKGDCSFNVVSVMIIWYRVGPGNAQHRLLISFIWEFESHLKSRTIF